MTKAIEINCETGQVVERDLTALEIEANEAAAAVYLEQKAEADRLAAEKAATKEAVLAKLGLTADEVAALLG
jgi:hypothetical protein